MLNQSAADESECVCKGHTVAAVLCDRFVIEQRQQSGQDGSS